MRWFRPDGDLPSVTRYRRSPWKPVSGAAADGMYDAYNHLRRVLDRPDRVCIRDIEEWLCPHGPGARGDGASDGPEPGPGRLFTEAKKFLQGLRLPATTRQVCAITAAEMAAVNWRDSHRDRTDFAEDVSPLVDCAVEAGWASVRGEPVSLDVITRFDRMLRAIYDAEYGPLDRMAYFLARDCERLRGLWGSRAAGHYGALSWAARHGHAVNSRRLASGRLVPGDRQSFIADWWHRCRARLAIADVAHATLEWPHAANRDGGNVSG